MLTHSASSGSRQTSCLPGCTGSGVAVIALLAVQVRMHHEPSSLRRAERLRALASIALAIPPQSGEPCVSSAGGSGAVSDW